MPLFEELSVVSTKTKQDGGRNVFPPWFSLAALGRDTYVEIFRENDIDQNLLRKVCAHVLTCVIPFEIVLLLKIAEKPLD